MTLPDRLRLAASPCFAVMTVASAYGGEPAMGMAMPGASLFGGMTVMYALMALFHAPVWLDLIKDRGRRFSK